MNARSFAIRMRPYAPVALVLLGVAAAIGACLQALDFPFISDDDTYLTGNAKLAGLRAAQLWRLLVEPYNPFEFLPLRDFSYWLDLNFFGMQPSAFRVDNMLLYAVCCMLVYAVTSKLWRYFRLEQTADARWAAASVAALFALHPAHVEAVVWISGRKDVLSGVFAMLALWLALSARRETGFSARYAGASLLAMLAAMLSKATAVALAPIVAVLWFMSWLGMPPPRRRLPLLWPLAGLVLAACAAVNFSSYSTIRLAPYWGTEIVTRTFAILGWMVRLAVSPESRHYFYPVLEDPLWRWMAALGVAVMLASMAAAAAVALRRRSLAGFSLLAFVLLCLPYLQLSPFSTHSLVTDRFVFLAVWPVLLLLVWAVWRLQPLARAIVLLLVASAWIYQDIGRVRDWRSYEALVGADLRAFPGHYAPAFDYVLTVQGPRGLTGEEIETANSIARPDIRNIVLGLIRADQVVHDASASAGSPQDIVVLLWKLGQALDQPPPDADWNYPLAFPYYEGNKILDREWMILARKFPDDLSVRYNAGLWQLNSGRYENAAANLAVAVSLPQLPEGARGAAMKNLGLALLKSGHAAEAEAPLRAALQQAQPDAEAYCPLAQVLRLTGRAGEAGRYAAACNNSNR